ncbi:hypothetical protein ELH26_07580 [Rhizobium leguminosarum]|uniref:Uncharacterized protein n=1 Tax=Rhizobium beringeri TaxID=3019934 RepID=A0ABY1XSJ1_9HYPH|nr:MULTISPECIES: hypothetical protein [Rhizobium]RWX01818.1 hypothetical protein EHI45_36305 [Rhizobium leguminosarum]TAU52713.1 hypothetical protein ELI43_07770 [Rhizobium leguminosarum]TBC72732.1 hypothetical protein ELH27_07615 [Rhizobium leguminosarum]TBC93890.1 hypothetical protein ELH26_07580 [Rhizobium leguminosarum]TBE70614.1 hypothetical protein ELH03_07495 [Rhizobium beringeri]
MIMTERHLSIFFDLQNRAWCTTDRCIGSKNVEDSGSPGISVEAINAAQSADLLAKAGRVSILC